MREVRNLSTEAVALYEDETLTVLSTKTTMDEIEARETKSDDLSEKWLVARNEEILGNSVVLIADAKKCAKRETR